MATRNRALLKSWFKRGLYPKAEQFGDWIDSFWHKDEDKIPVDTVENLPTLLNDKYARTDGEELERKHNQLAEDFAEHEKANENEFKNVYENIADLEAEDIKIWADIAIIHQDITDLQAEDVKIWADIATIHEDVKNLRAEDVKIWADIAIIHQDVKDLQAEDLEIWADIGTIHEDVKNLRAEDARIWGDIATIHQDVKDLEAEDLEIWGDIATIHEDVKDLQAEDVKLHETDNALQASLTSARNDIGTIREMLKAGASLADAKTALLALGTNYKDLYAVANTLKAFLESTDTADRTINTWVEIENFLQGVTDTQSLTAILNTLETKITTAYTEAIKNQTVVFTAATTRTLPASGDTLKIIIGKITKWFTDLKTVAFTGKASDITEDASHRFLTDTERTKLNGIDTNANRYVHPAVHPATIITEDASHRFLTDTERTKLNGIDTNANKYVHPANHPADIITDTPTKVVMTKAERDKLAGIASGSNAYVHPATHPATIITADATHRFVTDTEKNTWNGKAAGDHSHYSLNPSAIPASANLNNYTTPGMYYCAANATVATLTNSPTANAFSLLVEKHAGTKQTLTEYVTDGVKIFVRNYYSGTWGAWFRVYTTIDKPVYAWSEITGKPTTFTPATHSHAWADVTGKPSTFAPATHSHTKSQISDFPSWIGASKPVYAWSEITSKPTTFAPAAHTHAWADVTGKPSTFTPATHSHAWGDVTGKPTTFAPASHTHTKAQISDFPSWIDKNKPVYAWSEITGKPTTFTPAAHTHAWADVTGKPSTFAPASHTHTKAQISDFPTNLVQSTSATKITDIQVVTTIPAAANQVAGVLYLKFE